MAVGRRRRALKTPHIPNIALPVAVRVSMPSRREVRRG